MLSGHSGHGASWEGLRGEAKSGNLLRMPRSVPGRMLVAVRFAFGAASWLMPVRTLKLLGMDPGANREAAYVARLFGVRDAALGLGLVCTSGEARRLWWKIGIGCDLADVAAGIVSARNGQLPENVLV